MFRKRLVTKTLLREGFFIEILVEELRRTKKQTARRTAPNIAKKEEERGVLQIPFFLGASEVPCRRSMDKRMKVKQHATS